MVERRPPRVPGRLPLPLGRHLLRRTGPGGGGGGRRGGGQHPPLRRPPGQRGRRPARARRRGLRRGPRGRGGHDGGARRRGHPGAVPGPGRHGPDRSPAPTAPTGSPAWPTWPTPLEAALGHRVGTRVLVDPAPAPEPEGRERRRPPPPPPDDVELSRLLELASARLQRVSDLLRSGAEADGGPEGRRREGPGPERRRPPRRRPGEDRRPDLRRGGLGGRHVSGPGAAPLPHRRRADAGAALWPEVTAVLTSATIPPRLAERLGLAGFPVDELDVGSPFDYREHALLYVARHLPDRRRPESEPALHEELAALITAAGGRTLALFTSRRATEAAADALRGRLPFRRPGPGRAAQGPAAGRLRRGRVLLPLRHPRLLAGRRRARAARCRWSPWTASPSPAPTTPCWPPAASAPATAAFRAGRPPPGRHPAGPGRGPPHPLGRRPGRRGGARPAAGHRRLPPCPPGPLPAHAPHHRAPPRPSTSSAGSSRAGPAGQ